MRKALAVLFVIAVAISLCIGPALALDAERLGGYTELIDNTTFNNATTAKNTTEQLVLGNDKVAFFVKYTEMLANQSVTIVPQISQDSSTWINQTFYDIAGGATLQTSESITANGTYYFWLPEAAIVPYARINIIAINTTATNTISVQSYIVGSINYR